MSFSILSLAASRRRAASLLSALALTLGLLTVLAAPGFAGGSTSALQRCLTNAPPNQSETIAYNGGQPSGSFPSGTNPPNVILPGDVVHVTITGSVRFDLWGNTVGPDGTGTPAPSTGWPFPGKSKLSSIANWNNNPGGWVGSPMQTTSLSRCTPAPSIPVRLLFGINDPELWDNGGQWVIRTDVYWGP